MDALTETDKELLRLLAKAKEGSAYTISKRIHKSMNHVSFRLRVLRDRGIVSKKKHGLYYLDEKVKLKLVEYGVIGKRPQTKPISKFISGEEIKG